MEKQNTFRMGLAMAGAVSAGAYTAGVMDYLLEALENWQKAKELGIPGVPKHQVVIEVLSGASAGGMTAVLTAAAIQRKFPHINARNYQAPEARENPLYHSWVNLTEDLHNNMMDQMLSTGDISNPPEMNPSGEVRSLFNSLFIEKIARRLIETTVKDPAVSRPYVARDLELLTTITNLRGFNYELEFITAAGKKEDHMTLHKDLLHFQLNEAGTYHGDGKIPFHFDDHAGLNKSLMVDAAIATGAFPVGLAPRMVTRNPRYVNDNHLLKLTHGKKFLVDPLTDYSALCVDGGVINNEPYDMTEIILTNREKARRNSPSEECAADLFPMKKSAFEFDTTVVMIDPFPNFEDRPNANYFGRQALKITAPQLFVTMFQQLRVKTDLLAKAYDENDFSRFMIAPIRTRNGITQENSLACGALGGFSGFLSKKFRIHDFLLGRRNCQRFIREFLCVPVSANNPVIKYGYDDLTAEARQFLLSGNKKSLPILPDIRLSPDLKTVIRPPEELEFPYPAVDRDELNKLEKKVQIRLGVLLDQITLCDLKGMPPSGEREIPPISGRSWVSAGALHPIAELAGKLLWFFGKYFGKKLAARKLMDHVTAELARTGLLDQKTEKVF